LPEWYSGIQEATPDNTYPEVGGTVAAVYKAAGVNFKIKMTSKEYVRGQVLATEMEGMITGTNRWLYTPEGEGTQVSVTFEYEMPGGGIGQAVNKLIIEKMNAENLEKSLQNLKKLVEGSG
jgi:uncharacterized membrane protein